MNLLVTGSFKSPVGECQILISDLNKTFATLSRLFNIFVVQGAFVEILEQFFDGASIKDDWNPTSTGTILR